MKRNKMKTDKHLPVSFIKKPVKILWWHGENKRNYKDIE